LCHETRLPGMGRTFKVAVRVFGLMARSSPHGQHKLTIQQIFLLLACLR
jgi:hypothetical protein